MIKELTEAQSRIVECYYNRKDLTIVKGLESYCFLGVYYPSILVEFHTNGKQKRLVFDKRGYDIYHEIEVY